MKPTSRKKNFAMRSLTTLFGLTLCAASYGCDEGAMGDGVDVQQSFRSGSVAGFNKVFVIGDSLSDTWRMGSGLIPYCPNPKRGYWNKRFSNGYLWIDYLQQDNPELLDKVENYAVGGSGVLKRYGSCIIGKTKKQAEDMVKDHGSSVVANSLVVVWAGSNDIKEAAKKGSATEFAEGLFEALRAETIEFLHDKGVEHFVLVGLPPIHRIPISTTWTAAQREWVEIAVNVFNDRIKSYAEENSYVYLDVAEKIDEVLNGDVTSVNMTDLEQPCWDGPNCVEQGDTPGSYVDKRCEGKMFFDRVHPTSGAHCGIAKWMEQAISTQYDIDGGDQDLETCARRSHTDTRSVKFKVETPLDPSAAACQDACMNAGGTPTGERGNISLPPSGGGQSVGYCSCEV